MEHTLSAIDPVLQQKYQRLLADLRAMGSLAVAFSGGVDSTFLLAAAKEALGGRLLAVTASLIASSMSMNFPSKALPTIRQTAAISARRRCSARF